MQIHRCPECGIRLNTNYCHICMKRVPLKGLPEKRTFQHREGSSSHRTEQGHECVSFDTDQTRKKKPLFPVQRKRTGKGAKKASIVAIVVAAMSVISSLIGLAEDITGSEPVPEPMATAPAVSAIEPVEIYNDGAIVVTADFTDLSYGDYTVFMSVFNESPNDIIVGTDQLSVNGYMHASSFYAEVDSGDVVQSTLQLYTWELEQANIQEVAEIAFHLVIYDQQDYSDIARSGLITIETDIADSYEQPDFMDGWDLYRDEDLEVRLVSTALYANDCELLLYMENLSGQTMGVSVPESEINGKPVEGNLWTVLRPGTKVLATVYLYDGENASLDQFEEISLDLHLEYMVDSYVDATRTTNITFNPNAL